MVLIWVQNVVEERVWWDDGRRVDRTAHRGLAALSAGISRTLRRIWVFLFVCMALVDVSGEQITSCKLIAAMDAFVRTVAGVGTHVASDMLATSKRRAANGAFVISSHCVTAVSLSWILCALGLFSRGAVGGDSALLLALPGDFSCVYRCRRGALESVGAGAVEKIGRAHV